MRTYALQTAALLLALAVPACDPSSSTPAPDGAASGDPGGSQQQLAQRLLTNATIIMEAIDEVIHIGREGGLPVQISHIKMGDATAWGRSAEALQHIHEARDEGLDITAD